MKEPRLTSWEEILNDANLNGLQQGTTVSCQTDWGTRLETVLLEDLSLEERTNLAAHVVTCAACAAQLRDYQTIEHSVQSLPYQKFYADEPQLRFPTMLERIWEFRDQQEQMKQYIELKHTQERRMQKLEKMILTINLVIIIAVLILCLLLAPRKVEPLVFIAIAGLSSAVVFMILFSGRYQRYLAESSERKVQKQITDIADDSPKVH